MNSILVEDGSSLVHNQYGLNEAQRFNPPVDLFKYTVCVGVSCRKCQRIELFEEGCCSCNRKHATQYARTHRAKLRSKNVSQQCPNFQFLLTHSAEF